MVTRAWTVTQLENSNRLNPASRALTFGQTWVPPTELGEKEKMQGGTAEIKPIHHGAAEDAHGPCLKVPRLPVDIKKSHHNYKHVTRNIPCTRNMSLELETPQELKTSHWNHPMH